MQLRSYSKKKEAPPHQSQHQHNAIVTSTIQGINSVISSMSLCEAGNVDNLATINLSAQPGEKKRLLSITGAQTFLVNYAES